MFSRNWQFDVDNMQPHLLLVYHCMQLDESLHIFCMRVRDPLATLINSNSLKLQTFLIKLRARFIIRGVEPTIILKINQYYKTNDETKPIKGSESFVVPVIQSDRSLRKWVMFHLKSVIQGF